jgi:ABC-type Mn2+/Zn2+ transport system ATPase subunit
MTGQAENELMRLDGIGVWLGGREILRDVSFIVRAGEFTGLIGPNGAGRTTLLKIILGLQAAASGRVLLNGRPRLRRGGRLIGFVPQKLSIDPDMPLRARDVIAVGIDGNRLGFPLPSAARSDLVAEALRAVGAEAYADARVGELSGGEQFWGFLIAGIAGAAIMELIGVQRRTERQRGGSCEAIRRPNGRRWSRASSRPFGQVILIL